MTSQTIKELFCEYEASAASRATPLPAATRSNLRRLATLLPMESTALEFQQDFDALFRQLRTEKVSMPAGSFRALKSTAAQILRWAGGSMAPTCHDEMAKHLGMPPCREFAHWRSAPQGLAAYRLLLLEMSVGGVNSDTIDGQFLRSFLRSLPDRMKEWRAGWRQLLKCWERSAAAGALPALSAPGPPSRKPACYKIQIHELPTHLRRDLQTIERRLRGDRLRDRMDNTPMDSSTVELVNGTLLRLFGFLKNERGFDLADINMSDALSMDNARRLIRFTNERWHLRHGLTDPGDDVCIGEYELGIIQQLAMAVRYGLRDERLAGEYAQEVRFLTDKVEGRREAGKEHGHVEEYLHLACGLIEAAHATAHTGRGPSDRALLVRDALIIALLACFAPRISVLASLRMGEHVRGDGDVAVVLCIAREDTKPSRRDLLLELPPELVALWNEYISSARPRLLAGRKDHGFLWVARGGSPLSKQAIYAQFQTRCMESLGTARNPHQARKALGADFADWTGGDFLTLSAVIDASPLTLQSTYAPLQQVAEIKAFDAATQQAWCVDATEDAA